MPQKERGVHTLEQLPPPEEQETLMEQPIGLTCVRGGHHWGDDCLRPRPRARPGPRPGFLQLCGGRGAPNQQASALPRFFSRFVLRPRKGGGGA